MSDMYIIKRKRLSEPVCAYVKWRLIIIYVYFDTASEREIFSEALWKSAP